MSQSPILIHDHRTQFALTQQQLARWLGISRSAVASFERGHRAVPDIGLQGTRLDAAGEGLTYVADEKKWLPVPPQPLPVADTTALNRLLLACRHQLSQLRYALGVMQHRALPYEARYRALPALRAWKGPVKNAERELRWLDGFEAEAQHELRYVCGPVQQRLLQIRIAGQEREEELLVQAIAELTPPGAATEPAP